MTLKQVANTEQDFCVLQRVGGHRVPCLCKLSCAMLGLMYCTVLMNDAVPTWMHLTFQIYWCCCNMQCHRSKFKGLAGYCLSYPGRQAGQHLGIGGDWQDFGDASDFVMGWDKPA